jgi:hypothetical protein
MSVHGALVSHTAVSLRFVTRFVRGAAGPRAQVRSVQIDGDQPGMQTLNDLACVWENDCEKAAVKDRVRADEY